MTNRSKAWLQITGMGSVLLLLSGWLWWALSSATLMPTLARAAQVQRQTVPMSGSPPFVMPELFFNDRAVRGLNQPGSVQLTYTHRRVGDEAELRLTVRNNAPSVANLNMYLYSAQVPIQPLKRHRLAAVVTQARASDLRTQMAVGFHVFSLEHGYVGEWVGESGQVAWQLEAAQSVSTDYLASSDGKFNGRAANSLAPRVSVINVEPGAQVEATIRWHPVQIFDDRADAGTIDAASAPVVLVGPDRRLRVRVAGVGLLNEDGAAVSQQALVLRDASGKEWALSRPAGAWLEPLQQATSWEWVLPADVPWGEHALWFGLRGDDPQRWHPLRAGLGASIDGAGRVRVATVRVGAQRNPMLVGMSFHRYPGQSEYMLGPIGMGYDFARSLAVHGLHVMQWWTGVDAYDWNKLDAWANYHARDGRGLVMVFTGSPTWASQRPDEDSVMRVPGNAAPPKSAYMAAYARMVEATARRLKGRLKAIECWNEPDLRGSYSGNATELADLCKIVATQSRSVDPSVPVICPQPASPAGMPWVLGARTSSGEAITDHCDFVGAHVYGALGDDPQGRPYSGKSVAEQVRMMHAYMRALSVDKRLAVTEYGVAQCAEAPMSGHPPFTTMSSDAAGEALYQSIRAFREGGVTLLGLYSYDHEDNDRRCRPGGSFIRSTTADGMGRQSLDVKVLDRLNQARKDFGP